MISSIFLEHDDLEAVNRKLQAKYAAIRSAEQRSEEYRTEDAEVVLIGYGISGRLCRSAVDELRAKGIKAGCCARSRSGRSRLTRSASRRRQRSSSQSK